MKPDALNGIHSILPSPFDAQQRLDETSLRRLVDAFVVAGVDGVVSMGVFGEPERLDDGERTRAIEVAIDQTAGRIPVTVGISHPALSVVRARAQAAENCGASAVMVALPVADRRYVEEVRASTLLPVIVQDYPDTTGVRLSVELLASLEDVVVKLEDPPTAPKIAALRDLAPATPIFGGRGGIEAAHDLAAGAVGIMTGFSYPEVLVRIYALWMDGRVDEAYEVYNTHLSLIVFENQPGISLAVRKELLRRRGFIETAVVRSPAAELSAYTQSALDGLVERMERTSGSLLAGQEARN